VLPTTNVCDVCGEVIMVTHGVHNAPLLCIGDEPYNKFMHITRFEGNILASEMSMQGLPQVMYRTSSFWLHPKKAECQGFMYKKFLRELEGKKGCLIYGKELVEFLFGKKKIVLMGLNVTSSYLPAMSAVVVSPAPDEVMKGSYVGVGEFRNAIKNLKEYLNDGTTKVK
jgi:hypothetical protein